MTSITKNVIILIVFTILVSYIGRAEAKDRWDIWWAFEHSSQFVNMTELELCEIYYSCEVT